MILWILVKNLLKSGEEIKRGGRLRARGGVLENCTGKRSDGGGYGPCENDGLASILSSSRRRLPSLDCSLWKLLSSLELLLAWCLLIEYWSIKPQLPVLKPPTKWETFAKTKGIFPERWLCEMLRTYKFVSCSKSEGITLEKLRSFVTLDEWSDDEIDAMIEVRGNSSANSIYEAFIPEGLSKPGPDAGHEECSKFIRLVMI
ncbi:hypothetical protein C1H46_040240 [Malus baccata]|uniref:Uncharacterized protein n=1 Tax=Malus baccata TaxID=106549 RepID=A0A540KJ28_MALBA|nr:hypothetical protein C1H46_040240 [Malus baccata]